eukprot:g9643.t1
MRLRRPFQVIALDTNAKIDPNQIAGNAKARGLADALCGGRDVSQNFLEALAKAGEALVLERAKLSTATTILMIQHYPGWCPRALFENALPPERRGKAVGARALRSCQFGCFSKPMIALIG